VRRLLNTSDGGTVPRFSASSISLMTGASSDVLGQDSRNLPFLAPSHTITCQLKTAEL